MNKERVCEIFGNPVDAPWVPHRPQWKKFAQRQKESAKAYSDRLRQAFPFAQSAVKEHAAGVAKPDAADMKPRVILRQKGGLNKSAAGPGTTVSTLQDQKRLKVSLAMHDTTERVLPAYVF